MNIPGWGLTCVGPSFCFRLVVVVAWDENYDARRLPPSREWNRLRREAARRAGNQCEALMRDGSRCTFVGSECDHIVDRNDHSLSNLQWLCSWHHAMKTKREAREGMRAARARNMPRERKHPGLI